MLTIISAHSINPSWVALDSSRGIETRESKFFMRASVVAFDALIYVPALLVFSRSWLRTRSKRTQDLAFLVLITQPALFLVDFGHFQYNSVMLGVSSSLPQRPVILTLFVRRLRHYGSELFRDRK